MAPAGERGEDKADAYAHSHSTSNAVWVGRHHQQSFFRSKHNFSLVVGKSGKKKAKARKSWFRNAEMQLVLTANCTLICGMYFISKV